MALTIGTPNWLGAMNLDGRDYPAQKIFGDQNIDDISRAHEAYFQANDAWHVTVGGYHLPEAPGVPSVVIGLPHPAKRLAEAAVRTRHPRLKLPRPKWLWLKMPPQPRWKERQQQQQNIHTPITNG